MGNPNEQWGSSERVRGGAGSNRFRATDALETPRKMDGRLLQDENGGWSFDYEMRAGLTS